MRLAMLGTINGSVGQIVRRVAVRKSSVHGRGVFALRTIAAGQRILEYRGEATSWRRASVRHRRSGTRGHTFMLGLADGRVIDGSVGGNGARWLNHSCQPDCETVEDERRRVFIETIRAVMPAGELFIAYGLTVEEPVNALSGRRLCLSPRCEEKHPFDAGRGERITSVPLAGASGFSFEMDRRRTIREAVRELVARVHGSSSAQARLILPAPPTAE